MKPVLVPVLVLVSACAGNRALDPSQIDADDAIVKIDTPVTDAALWIDGRFIGPIGTMRGGFAIEPGRHRIELRHDGYWSHYEDLALAPAQRLDLVVELAPVLP